MFGADAGQRERHTPPVGVEHRQRVQIDVAVCCRCVQGESGRVDPDVAVGDLHALGPRGGAGGVVDGRGRRLVRLPHLGLDAFSGVQVIIVAQHESVLGGDVLEGLVELGIDIDDPSARVLDDVADLGGLQPEVHWHQHSARTADAVERRQQPCAVVADDRHAISNPDAQLVELGRLPLGQHTHLGVGDRADRCCRLVRLVDHGDPIRIDRGRSINEVVDAERNEHEASQDRQWEPTLVRPTLPFGCAG